MSWGTKAYPDRQCRIIKGKHGKIAPPRFHRQCRAAAAPHARLQPRQFHADLGAAARGEAVVTDAAARQARQDRRQGRTPRSVPDVPAGLLDAGRHCRSGERVAVVNEGLLMYLTRNEKTIVAENIHTFLARRGGIWITPDVATKTYQRIASRCLFRQIATADAMTTSFAAFAVDP